MGTGCTPAAPRKRIDGSMNGGDILETQRTLRRQLFEGPSAIRWRPARELAAQLLLYLDDPGMCWQLAADWVRAVLDADRADGGFGGFFGTDGAAVPYVAVAESQRASMVLPPMLGRSFDACEPSIRALWHGACLMPVSDVAQESRMTPSARETLLALGTAAKLALPVSDGTRPIGLLCADWHRGAPKWRTDVCNEMTSFAQETLGPVLGAAVRLVPHERAPGLGGPRPGAWERVLTPAEARVARLVAQGLSYKEVARELGRSLSTVDHQLRSIRQKLGVASTARLVRILNERAGH